MDHKDVAIKSASATSKHRKHKAMVVRGCIGDVVAVVAFLSIP